MAEQRVFSHFGCHGVSLNERPDIMEMSADRLTIGFPLLL